MRASRDTRSTGSVVAALALAALAAGCTAGPDYVPPEPPAARTGDGWSVEQAEGTAPAEPERWWERFGDPTLDRLVETALARNLDLLEATERVEEARAVRDRAAGERLPRAAVGGGVERRRLSEEGPLPVDSVFALERDETIFDVGFDASWEADLAGRTRRAVEAADARVGGAEELRAAVELRVAAEVARAYLELRDGQRRLGSLEAAAASLRRTAELVGLRVEAGEEAPVELARVETELYAVEASLPLLEAELRAAALAIGVLAGGPPERELGLLATRSPPADLAPPPLGERAEILGRRPDVRTAERSLAAATADIGVATAELYPRLSIGARGGFQAVDAGELPGASSVTWSLMPAISWRIFDGGRVQAEIRIAEARAAAAARAWEAAVLTALADAERALARYRGGLEALDVRRRAVAAAERVRRLERLRYEAGESSLLGLVDAERRLDEAEASLATTRMRTSTELIALIKALGGGWAPPASSAPPPARP